MHRPILLLACLLLPFLAGLGCKSSGEDEPFVLAGQQPLVWSEVTRQRWRLVELDGLPVARADSVDLKLGADGRVSGHTGVNQVLGGFEHGEDDTLHFSALSSTRMAGPPDAMELEEQFLAALAETDAARMANGRLVLLSGEQILMRFQPTK